MSSSHPPAPQGPLPLRVLHISGRSDHGGGPEHLLQAISADLCGIVHHIACPESGLYWNRFCHRLGRDHLCSIPHRRLSLAALLDLRTFARAQKIQVIHSHGMSGGIYGRLLGLLTGLPVLHTFHGVPVTPGLKHRFYQIAELALAQITNCGIAVSAGEADLVHKRWKSYRGRLAVVPNGIDIGNEPPPWSPWPNGDEVRIVSFSRRNHQKHPELLIEIARCLTLLGARFRMDAYGEGLDHPELAAEALRRGVGDHLYFHPPTDDPGGSLMGRHVYLSTSRWEGMPLAVLEAWRSGLVVVATDVIGNRDLVADGQTGCLFPSGQGRRAARMIHALVADTAKAEQIRTNSARRASLGHGRDLMALRLEWLYHRMCRGMRQVEPTSANHWPDAPAEADDSRRLPLRTVNG